jgi:hypothetical protein
MVELLGRPDLTHADVVSAACLRYDVVYDVDGIGVGKERDSGRHTASNWGTPARYSDLDYDA